jgi:hypothetical protein
MYTVFYKSITEFRTLKIGTSFILAPEKRAVHSLKQALF